MENKTQSVDRITKVTFLSFTDLRLGAGTERVILNLISNYPSENIEVQIIETDYYDKIRISNEDISKMIPTAKIVKIKSIDTKFKFLRSNVITSFLYSTLLKPLGAIFQSQEFKKVAGLIKDSDIVYLTRNSDIRYLVRFRGLVIGSSHTMSRLENLLATRGLLYKRINYYHFLSQPKLRETKCSRNIKYFVIPNGVDSHKFSPIYKGKIERIRFLYTGRLEKYKGIGILVKAWTKISDLDGIELHIVGGGAYERKLNKLNLSTILYHGVLSDTEVQKIFSESDIFVYPTKRDIYPLVVLEALSSGLFVITSETLRGVLDDFSRIGALKYVKNSPGGILNEIYLSCRNIQEINDVRSQVHEYISSNYDWRIISNKFFDKILQLYYELNGEWRLH